MLDLWETGHRSSECTKGKGLNHVGTEGGLNLGGGEKEGGSEGGQTQPEKEPNSEHAQPQTQQGEWNQGGCPDYNCQEDWGHGGYYEQYYPGPYEYGAWNFTKDEPKEEWKVVESKENKKKKQEERMIASAEPEEYEDITVDAVMDSGAFDTICPLEMIGGSEIRETKSSKAGMDYYAITGAGIRNKGEVDLVGVSEKGTPTKFTTQVG